MAQITVKDLYMGAKYDVMGHALSEYFKLGRPMEFTEDTWVDMLLVKHTALALEKMKTEGDTLSGMYDGESPSSYVRWNKDDNT